MKVAEFTLDPIQKLILAYASRRNREHFALLFAFDSRLAEIIRTTSETLIGQMKLTWWRDILTKSPDERPSGEPLVEGINLLERGGADTSNLLCLVDGWELLLDDLPWDDALLEAYCRSRGLGFFSYCHESCHSPTVVQENMAQAWALWDLAHHCSDDDTRDRAFDKCMQLQKTNERVVFDKNGRPYSILCKLVESDVRKGHLEDGRYTPSTARKIIWHGLTGC